MTKEEKKSVDIIALFQQWGNEDYDGEPVSQTSHMIQCAQLAIAANADAELVLSAFLHDIGHLLKHTYSTESMGSYGVLNHEGIGEKYLRDAGFSAKVCAVVAHHVQAKRYLVATDEAYKDRLSAASWKTLQWQGGPMPIKETIAFEQHPFFNEIIQVRLWDEAAKVIDSPLLSLNYFKVLITKHLKEINEIIY